jgi:hypothetical protein
MAREFPQEAALVSAYQAVVFGFGGDFLDNQRTMWFQR